MSDLTRKVVEEVSSEVLEPRRTHPKNCRACAHSYMEPSGPTNLICGHPDSFEIKPVDHCGNFEKFEQHPHRDQEGSLKDFLPTRMGPGPTDLV